MNSKISKPFPFFICLAIIVFVIACDQYSKFWVLNKLNLINVGHIEISRFFDLTMVWNRGVSFGIFRADSDFGRWALVGVTSLISILFSYWLFQSKNRFNQISLSLVIGGAIGNLIDRVRLGAVADFLNFEGLYFPWVFNIADSAVVLGAILLAIDLLFDENAKTLPNNKVESE